MSVPMQDQVGLEHIGPVQPATGVEQSNGLTYVAMSPRTGVGLERELDNRLRACACALCVCLCRSIADRKHLQSDVDAPPALHSLPVTGTVLAGKP